MKNFYELSTEEKDKYRREFNKLKFTKDVNVVRGPSLFIAIVSIISSGIFSSLVDEGLKLQTLVDTIDTVGIIMLGVFAILEVYLNISFKRWMKIKHNVEY